MIKSTYLCIAAVLLFTSGLFAQKKNSIQQHKTSSQPEALVHHVRFQNIGPSIMSGRVVDLKVNPESSTEFFVAYATGGLWHTANNGTSFTPVFDEAPTQNIGAFDVNWTQKAIWVGTGEVNSSRSSYAGKGMFYSKAEGDWLDDEGKFNGTWEHRGLENSHHIGKVIIDPNNPNRILVAVMGQLYTQSGDQGGLFQSFDKGRTWVQMLEVENAGFVDLELNPYNNELFAAAWQRERKAWDFVEGGPASDIYHSADKGKTWKKLREQFPGFVAGNNVGRIGLSLYADADSWVLYASVDNQNEAFKKEDKLSSADQDKPLNSKDFKTMSMAEFEALPDSVLSVFLEENDFGRELNPALLREEIQSKKLQLSDIYNYFYDANNELFNKEIVGLELYKFASDAHQCGRTHDAGALSEIVYSYGYYFGMVEVDPSNPDRLIVAGVPMICSEDGGTTWSSINADNVHVDHHCIWINPKNPQHLINGNDGGINISYDGGKHYVKCNSPAVGQFYTVNVDQAKPYRVYGGLQDNGVWRGPNGHVENSAWHQDGKYAYDFLMGGDGMKVEIDWKDNTTVYTGYQFGHYYRIDPDGKQTYIHPKHQLGEAHLRWNWQTPIQISKHLPEVIYMASNRFHRSLDKGDTWETLSEDLTTSKNRGDVPYATSTSIDESPLKYGLLALGTDDGHVHVSKDGGNTWTHVSKKLPKDLWVSRVRWSAHQEGTLYVTLNGYRNDHFAPYVFKSLDYGATWINISAQLPHSPVNVILPSSVREGLLFVGNDEGLFVSLDDGDSYAQLGAANFPNVAVHDLAIAEREQELIIATHGRSLYKLDISLLQENLMNEAMIVCETVKYGENLGQSWNKWIPAPIKQFELQIFLPEAQDGTLEVLDQNGEIIFSKKLSLDAGLHQLHFDQALVVSDDGSKKSYPVGIYEVRFSSNTRNVFKGSWEIVE